MFKQGAFVNILTSDPEQWKKTLADLDRLPALDHVEMWVEHIPKGNELHEIRDIFRGVPLIVHGPFIHTSLVSHVPDVIALSEKRFDAALEFASKMAARVVTFHAGSYPLFEPREHALEKLANRFERFTKLRDPVTTLENMPIKSHGTTKEPIGKLSCFDEVLELLPDLRFTLDIGHCLQNEDDFVSFLQKHAARIENIHLHDGLPKGRGHLRLGDGQLNLSKFLDTLQAVSFGKYVSMETISLDDTSASWATLCELELLKGIRIYEAESQREWSNSGRNRIEHRQL